LLPALDGLRALAVVAVLLYHAEVRLIPGGFLGVESFFVVSGYLITALMWTEVESTGRLGIVAFWIRRARRLLPALGVLVAATTLGLVAFYGDMVARARGELVAAAAYVSNWYLIVVEQSYFAEAGRPSPLRHLWSLAVEEQFYLAFPLLFLFAVFMVGRRPRRLALVAGVAAAASAALMWLLYQPAEDPSRVYYGTDTRASGLLIGVTLALLWRPWEREDRGVVARVGGLELPSRWPDVLAAGGLGVLLLTALRFSEADDVVYRGGIQLVAGATALVIAGSIVPGSSMGRALGGRIITAVGRRSYSLYLWHWPIYVTTRPGLDLPWSSGPVLVIRLVLTTGVAELSYRCVERPVREGALGRFNHRLRHALTTAPPAQRVKLRRRCTAATVAAAAAFVMVSVAVLEATPPPPLSAVLSSESGLVATGYLTAQPEPGPDRSTAPPPPGASVAAGRVDAPGPTPTSGVPDAPSGPPSTSAAPSAPGARTVYAVGDSVMLGATDALVAALPGIAVNAAVGRQVSEGVDIVRSLAAQNTLPQVLLVHLGNNGDARASQFDDLISAAGPALIVLVTVKVERRWEGPNNDIIRSFVDRPNVRIADWKNVMAGCSGSIFFPDGTHLRADGQACYASHIAPLVLAP